MELSINNVTKQFKDKKAVNDISFSMGNGVYGLLGVNGADAPGTGQTDKVLVGEVFQPDALFAGIGRICRHCQKDAFLEQLIAVFVAGRDLEILPCENRDVRILALGVLEKLKVQPVVILLIGDQRLGHQRRCRQHVQTDGGLPFLRQVLELVRNLVQRL